MKKLCRNIPDGTRDIIFDEALINNQIIEKLTETYIDNGFRQIETPVFEYYDVFDFEGQSISEENMYKFTDANGRLAVLRPDNTTPIARVAATKLRNAELPLKIFYNQKVYRIISGYSGKRSEIMQSGIEIIGADGIRSEFICIITALEAMKNLGLSFKLDIGHVGFYNALASELELSEEETGLLRKYVNSKDTVSLGDIGNTEKLNKIKRLPLLFGGEEIFSEAKEIACGNTAALEALAYTESLYNMLTEAGYKDMIAIDLGMVHEIDYYTGIIFRGYVNGIGEAALSGGRYNNLIKNFEYDLPATGFAINVCLVAEATEKTLTAPKYKNSDYVIYFDNDMFSAAQKVKNGFDKDGKTSEYSVFGTRDETIEWACRNKIKHAVMISKSGIETIDISNYKPGDIK